MSQTKKLLSLLLAIMMVMSISAAALAENNYTIAIKNDKTGFTYQAYQIFTGDLSTDGTTLSNIKWGTGISETGKEALYAKYGLTTDADKTAAKVAEKIAADTSTTKADDIATLLAKTTGNALGTPISMSYNESITVGAETFKGYAAVNQPSGWYLVNNTAVPENTDDTYSDYVVQVVKDVAVEPKSDKPSSDKHVDDNNDSNTSDAQTMQDSADYDIGDSVHYTLRFTLPADYANYTTYAVDFYDDMSAGLDWNGDATIHYGTDDTDGSSIHFDVDNSKTSDYTHPTTKKKGKVYKFSIANLKTTANSLVAGDVITIEYNATLDSDAVVGSAGNPNRYMVSFSNNPNAGASGDKGDTPWDKNIVFTFKAVFNKVKPDGSPLTGADFTLYKFVEGAQGGTDEYNNKTGKWTDVTTLGVDGKRPTKVKTDSGEGESLVEDCIFTFTGLDAGVYKLSETTTPNGYNTMEDKIFEITATHETNDEDPQLTALATTGAFTLTGELSTGKLETDIENNQGSILPTTGGMGTTLLYVGGVALVAAAAILLVFKKRMSVEK